LKNLPHRPALFPASAAHIGTDESGKGDYFGPLVVAGFLLEDEQAAVLKEFGVKDSKNLSDNRCREIAEILKKGYTHSLVVIGPEKYNELYEKMRNLNRILAWGHARAIENILERVPCPRAVTDQFGDEAYIVNALMKKGKAIELMQKPRAEEDLAVAAASILARAEFLKRLFFLGQEWGLDLPKGSALKTEEAALKLIRKHGVDVLGKAGKLHFKITARVLRTRVL
jgi:ribonuclease HIII